MRGVKRFKLSEKQTQIVFLSAKGELNRNIAEIMLVTERGIYSQLEKIRRKTQKPTITAAISAILTVK